MATELTELLDPFRSAKEARSLELDDDRRLLILNTLRSLLVNESFVLIDISDVMEVTEPVSEGRRS